MQIELKENQFEVFNDQHRFIVLVAGRRWAKTTTLLTKLAVKAFEKRGLYGYFAPTYRQAKMIAWDILKGISPRQYVLKINESELCISYKNLSKIRLFGLDKPEGILGIKLAGALIDEYDHVKTNAYESVIRPALSDSLGFCWFAGSPDSRQKRLKTIYEDAKINKRSEWATYQFKSCDGGYIPIEEIENARRELDPRTFRENYEATFEDAMGRVYYGFDFDSSVSDKAIYNPNTILRVFWDFNVDPLCVGFGHSYQELDDFRQPVHKLHCFDELVIRNSNTLEMCRAIGEKFKNHKGGMVHYGDATSKARNTASSLSDYQIIYDFFKNCAGGCQMRFKDSNPAVKDRINAVNSMLLSADGKRRLLLNAKCKKIIKDLLDVSYKEGTCEIDKTNPELTHACFAAGTKVETDKGIMNIEDVPKNGRVRTWDGSFVEYRNAKKTLENVDTVLVCFEDGHTVQCTPEHLFLTTGGWTCAKDLKGSEIQSWQSQLSMLPSKTSTVKDFIDTTEKRDISESLLAPENNTCIGSFGFTILERLGKVCTSITSMVIGLITRLKTSIFCLQKNTAERILQKSAKINSNHGCLAQEKPLSNGTLQQREISGTQFTERMSGLKYLVERFGIRALNAASDFILRSKEMFCFAERLVKHHIVILQGLTMNGESALFAGMNFSRISISRQCAAQDRAPQSSRLKIVDVVPSSKEDVYCVFVPSTGCFCLSNGSIVSNSDALGYWIDYDFPVIRGYIRQ